MAGTAAVVRAFETVLGHEPGQLIVPEHHCYMAALGAAFIAMDEDAGGRLPRFGGLTPRRAAALATDAAPRSLPRLRDAGQQPPPPAPPAPQATRIPVFLGVDVGSVSTNLALVDEHDRVVAWRYLPTPGRPLEAVRRGLIEIGAETAGQVEVKGVATTGSGRHLAGHFVGADFVRNEITAQARAALAVDPEVVTRRIKT